MLLSLIKKITNSSSSDAQTNIHNSTSTTDAVKEELSADGILLSLIFICSQNNIKHIYINT